MQPVHTDLPRAGRFEILGAWLHVWTPPRGVQVPPVPWRKVALGAAVAAIALGGLAAWLVPRIEHAKRHNAQLQRSQQAAAARQEEQKLRYDQRLQRGRAGHLASGRSPAALRRRAAILVSDLQASITADANARARSGELDGPIARTQCQPYPPGSAPSGPVPPTRYACVAVTADIRAGTRRVAGAVGYPFWARLDLRAGTYLWCRINPSPGEQAIGSALATVPLPRPCNLEAG